MADKDLFLQRHTAKFVRCGRLGSSSPIAPPNCSAIGGELGGAVSLGHIRTCDCSAKPPNFIKCATSSSLGPPPSGAILQDESTRSGAGQGRSVGRRARPRNHLSNILIIVREPDVLYAPGLSARKRTNSTATSTPVTEASARQPGTALTSMTNISPFDPGSASPRGQVHPVHYFFPPFPLVFVSFARNLVPRA